MSDRQHVTKIPFLRIMDPPKPLSVHAPGTSSVADWCATGRVMLPPHVSPAKDPTKTRQRPKTTRPKTTRPKTRKRGRDAATPLLLCLASCRLASSQKQRRLSHYRTFLLVGPPSTALNASDVREILEKRIPVRQMSLLYRTLYNRDICHMLYNMDNCRILFNKTVRPKE